MRAVNFEKCSIFSTAIGAYIEPFYVSIPVGEFMACVNISASDNDYVENDRSGLIFVNPAFFPDTVNGPIYLTIIDDDGKTRFYL